jgi:exopolysaccharide production protein ExoQ
MNSSLATLVYALGILGLFYLNRDKSVTTSRALWIPVIWFWILGSRTVSFWLGGPSTSQTVGGQLEGSPIDALVFQLLIACGLVVVARRSRSLSVLSANWPIILYFSFCLISVVWSDFLDVSIKRWVKATGDVVMALVVATDPQPVAALRRLFSRVGFVLLPTSVLFIKYYPYLSRSYDQWSGQQLTIGVATDKNLLGVSVYLLTLGTLWQIVGLWRNSDLPNRSHRLLAQCSVLGFGIWTLNAANSATSELCFGLASMVMVLTSLRRNRGRVAAAHSLILTIILLGGLIKITGADAALFQAMGRKADLTGRVDIWPLLLRMAPNALIGAGFESFWLGPRLQKVFDAFPNLFVSEAHNGYIELYLNLGAVGVVLIIIILVHGYYCSIAAFRVDPDTGSLMLGCMLTAAIYSYTEAGFRMLSYPWGFLMIFIVTATSISLQKRAVVLDGPRPAAREADRLQRVGIEALREGACVRVDWSSVYRDAKP